MTLQTSQHPQYRVHTVGFDKLPGERVSGHRIQRIVGLPLSWVTPQPRAPKLRFVHSYTGGLHLADQLHVQRDASEALRHNSTRRGKTVVFHHTHAATDAYDDGRTPLDYDTSETIDDACSPLKGYDQRGAKLDDYDGFAADAAWADQGHVGVHDELEQAADDFLAMADQTRDSDITLRSWCAQAGIKVEPREMRVPGLKPVWDADVTDGSPWVYKPYTYTIGFTTCPRCNGTPHRFGERSCRYCKQQGGWPLTRVRTTPWHPQLGWSLTPPKPDLTTPASPRTKSTTYFEDANTTSHDRDAMPRVSGPYYGDVRIKQATNGSRPRPNDAVYSEIRRRHFEYTTRRELQKLAVADYAHATSAQLIAA